MSELTSVGQNPMQEWPRKGWKRTQDIGCSEEIDGVFDCDAKPFIVMAYRLGEKCTSRESANQS